MTQYLPMLVCTIMLAGCSGQALFPDRERTGHHGYFADAAECNRSSLRKEAINLPIAGSISVVEVPIIYDSGRFTACMEYARRPVSKTDETEYMKISAACLNEAQGAEQPDEKYADCIERSQLDVKIITAP